jgi:hypothetical protein
MSSSVRPGVVIPALRCTMSSGGSEAMSAAHAPESATSSWSSSLEFGRRSATYTVAPSAR